MVRGWRRVGGCVSFKKMSRSKVRDRIHLNHNWCGVVRKYGITVPGSRCYVNMITPKTLSFYLKKKNQTISQSSLTCIAEL